jgi:hypothetical protein
VRLVSARALSAVGALVLTGSAVAVSLAGASTETAATADVLDSEVVLAQRSEVGPVSQVLTTGRLAAAAPESAVAAAETGLDSLSALAVERELLESRALAADQMLETVRAARQEAAVAAARSAERERLASLSPRDLGQFLAADRGWTGDQWSCLDSLWQRESNWNPSAQNPSSGAYGIPQALPGSKMGTVAGDWQTNPATQITWGLNYIRDVYGTPCGAWAHSESHNWY